MILYNINILPLAEEDIVNQTDYIAFELKAPETAIKIARGLRKTINNLSIFPHRHEIDEDEELAGYEIRKIYYKNYKIYFVIEESKKIVYILRVFHMLVDSKRKVIRGYYDGRRYDKRGTDLFDD